MMWREHFLIALSDSHFRYGMPRPLGESVP